MITISIYFFLIAVLFIILYVDNTELRLFSLFIGLLLFPNAVALMKNPVLTPRDLFLYSFICAEIYHHYPNFIESLKKFPLKKASLFLFAAYFATGLSTGENGLIKSIYEAFRAWFDLFAFCIICYIAGYNISLNDFIKRLFIPFFILCVLGFIEASLQANYPFKYICSAFPIYNGVYNLSGMVNVSDSWRTRICITTDHPNALSPILITTFFLFLPKLKDPDFKKTQMVSILIIIAFTTFLCGSRTGMLTLVVLLGLWVLRKTPFIVQFFVIVSLITSLMFGAYYYIIDQFEQEGQGSSLSMRQAQLLISLNYFMENPVAGNGLYFINKKILERNSSDRLVGDKDAKFFESYIFHQLINFGLTGILSYSIFILAVLSYFFRRRHQNETAIQGLFISLGLFIFLILNGQVGSAHHYGLALIGLFIGNCQKESQLLLETSTSKDSH